MKIINQRITQKAFNFYSYFIKTAFGCNDLLRSKINRQSVFQ